MFNSPSGRLDIQALVRSLSAVGVILSLLFVGLELRQTRQLARAQVRQGLAERNAVMIYAVAQNPELARAWTAMWLSADAPGLELSAADSTQANYAMFGLVRQAENVYLQFLEGVVDESVLNSYGFRNTLFARPQFKLWWPRYKSGFDPRFIAVFEAEYGL